MVSDFWELFQQPAPETVVVNRYGMPGCVDLMEIRLLQLLFNQFADILGSFPNTGNLPGHDLALQFRSRPDATQGLEQSDEIEVIHRRVHHAQPQRNVSS